MPSPEGMDLFSAQVVSVKGRCNAGHQAGQELTINCWETGGMCGFFYHQIFHNLSVFQFGGAFPWAPEGELTLECPDKENLVTIKLSKQG